MTAERVARNEAAFREANESIREAAQRYGAADGLPFICECAEPGCMEILRLVSTEYEAVRATPTHFITAPGHHRASEGWGKVVEQRDGYEIVEKVGHAANVAEELDPRSE